MLEAMSCGDTMDQAGQLPPSISFWQSAPNGVDYRLLWWKAMETSQQTQHLDPLPDSNASGGGQPESQVPSSKLPNGQVEDNLGLKDRYVIQSELGRGAM